MSDLYQGNFTRSFETYHLADGQTEIRLWLLKGTRGIIQFKAGPCSPDTHEITVQYPGVNTFIDGWPWIAWDLGYHSPRPTYDGQRPMDSCDVLDMQCYYDGTSLGARDLLNDWAASGCDDDVIWREMANRYEAWLCSDDEVAASPVTTLFVALKRGAS